ncbi:MAG: hypothetical protein HOM11_18325 [Methylococcales bacterium]|jgi:hypothetical protein|nr:hypothetical protein [Methylococcales bacterium]MBT7443792.1 hypothetical protein [Methylococcales bacterium]
MSDELIKTHAILANTPLLDRLPKRDKEGKPLSDFMMRIPKLRDKPAHILNDILANIHAAAAPFGDDVVYLDVNLKINLLWVSVRAVPGILTQLPAAIRHRVPEALLIANQAEVVYGAAEQK